MIGVSSLLIVILKKIINKMKQKLSPLLTGVLILLCTSVIAQKNDVQTVFKKGARSSGGYGALTNQFSTIRGKYVNMAGLYGG